MGRQTSNQPDQAGGSGGGDRPFWIVAIAVSTGGPAALQHVVPRLPADFPVPVVVVQHMPAMFTKSLAESLDSKSPLTVVEGRSGDILRTGHVYIAPGERHLEVLPRNRRAVISLNDKAPEQGVRPAADVLFRSLAAFPTSQPVLAVVMTGMGEDGLAGLRFLKERGCHCLTQTAETCVVYGMPRAVELAGLSDAQVPLDDIAPQLVALTRSSVRRPRR